MILEIKMPQLGESLTEGTIIKWLKNIGDFVKKDESILEISTDKVDSEIPSPVDGVLVEILAKENQTVLVDEVIARVDSASASEEIPNLSKETEKATDKSLEKKTDSRKKNLKKSRKQSLDRFYSPLVLNIARREGISMGELELIPGYGTNGRVTKNDILNYLKIRSSSMEERKISTTSREPKRDTGENVIPMDPIRKKIASHMRKSLDTSAHVYSVSECDVTPILNIISKKKDQFLAGEGFKLTITPFILTAVRKAILDFPRINCSLDGENIIEKKYIHLGMAVATDRGLIVPVVKHAEEKSFVGIARTAHDLVNRARKNELSLTDVQGATLTITNYGVFGNILGFPIINQPNVAILGVGAIKKRPVIIETSAGDTVGIRSMVYISMSYDHRVVDGELGGKFMERVVEYLENFEENIL
jgi:2-oxoglutarate dehydrogenase complex dihydrolipoamide succinyltransferase (E2) component